MRLGQSPQGISPPPSTLSRAASQTSAGGASHFSPARWGWVKVQKNREHRRSAPNQKHISDQTRFRVSSTTQQLRTSCLSPDVPTIFALATALHSRCSEPGEPGDGTGGQEPGNRGTDGKFPLLRNLQSL